MKALSIRQPWASLVAHGIKKFETRSWRTDHRGWLAIHASKAFDHNVCYTEPIQGVLIRLGITKADDLSLGAILAFAYLEDIVPTEEVIVPDRERGLGDFSAGRYAWRFDEVIRLPEPQPAKGALRLWEWEITDRARGLIR